MPDISLDKKKIAFLCGKWVEQLGRIDYKLCIANVDGTGIKRYQILTCILINLLGRQMAKDSIHWFQKI